MWNFRKFCDFKLTLLHLEFRKFFCAQLFFLRKLGDLNRNSFYLALRNFYQLPKTGS